MLSSTVCPLPVRGSLGVTKTFDHIFTGKPLGSLHRTESNQGCFQIRQAFTHLQLAQHLLFVRIRLNTKNLILKGPSVMSEQLTRHQNYTNSGMLITR